MSDSASNSGLSILRLYWDILRLRRGPEDLPASAALLAVTVVIRVGLGLLANELIPEPRNHPNALMLIDVVVALAWGRIVLMFAGKPERYLQMMSAIYGCELILQAFSAVAVGLFVAGQATESAGLSQIATLIVTVTYVWILLAVVRILRSATEWSIFSCVMAVIAQAVVTLAAALMMFPDLLSQMMSEAST